MGEITVKPEQKPEQRRGTDGNGGKDGLAWGLTCFGEIHIPLTMKDAPQTVWRRNLTPLHQRLNRLGRAICIIVFEPMVFF